MLTTLMGRASACVALALASTGTGLAAQATRPGQPLRLTTVQDLAITGSPGLRALRAEAGAAEAMIGPAGALPDPMLEVGTLNRNLRDGFELMPITGMNMIGLRQVLPLGGVLGSATEAAEARAQEATALVSAGEFAQRRRATASWHALYALERSLAVAIETRDLMRAAARAAEALYRVGRGRQADVVRAQAEVTRMTEEIIRMDAERRQEVAGLGALLDLDLDPDTLVVAGAPLPTSLPPADSLVVLALHARPALAASTARITALEAEVDRAGGMRWPELSLSVGYGWRPMPTETEQMLSLMAGVSLPVWSGRKQGQMLEATRAMRDGAASDRAMLEAETRGAVRSARTRWDEARRLEAVYAEALEPQARASVATAESGYAVGEVDFLALLEAHRTLNRVRQERHRLVALRGTALAELEELTGTMLAGAPAGEAR